MSQKQFLFDVHGIHEVDPLVASASSLDSTSSIGTASSPTLLVPESETFLHDVRPSHGASAVKFAPLPRMDPNRKRTLAPVGVSARLRRRRVLQQEDWSADSNLPEEAMEDPIIVLAKFVKRATKTLWRRVRQDSKAVSQEDVSYSAEPVLDISSGDMAPGENDQEPEVVGGEDKRGCRASWSPPAECRTLSKAKAMRRSTSDIRLPATP